MTRRTYLIAMLVFLGACAKQEPAALGTLEYDLVRVPAPVFERIASIAVVEGQRVAAGDTLMILESARVNADVTAAREEVVRLQAMLDEAKSGPRPESIAEARARLEGAQGVRRNARSELTRVEDLVSKQLIAKAELDRAQAARTTADANVRAAQEGLLLLTRGTRSEQLAQSRAALAAAQARVERLTVDADRTRIAAPREGRVDSLPFEVGDQVQPGTTLATVLVGESPYARVYVPQPMRQSIKVGSVAEVKLVGDERVYRGRVRSIRNDPSFTPYYALSGNDASRLSWLAEIELERDAAQLPAGLPLRATFEVPRTP
jgi:HlyD family secretion protein